MTSRFVPYKINFKELDNLQEIDPVNYFKVCNLEELPITLPPDLKNKLLNKAVIASSGTDSYQVYMINLARIDNNDVAIDQQPLVIARTNIDGKWESEAGFIEHGDWEDRTVHPGELFFAAIEGSGIKEHYPYEGFPEKDYGKFSELQPASQRGAFWKGVELLKRVKNGK